MKTLILLLVSVIYGFYAALPFTSLRERQGYYFIMHYSVDDGDIIDGCKKWDSAFKDDYADMERRDF